MQDTDRVTIARLISDLHEKLIDLEIRVSRLEAISNSKVNESGRLHLAELLARHFSLTELENLSFDVSVNGDEITGSTRGERARELISYCERRDILGELIARCREKRPKVLWPYI